jgi:hypothetical protein
MTSAYDDSTSIMDSPYFKTRYTPDRNRGRVWKAICEYLQHFIPADAVVLEVGAGYCDFINQIKAAKKYALDVSPDVAGFCAPDVQFVLGKAGTAIELPSRSLDVVVASNLLEHLSPEQCSDLFDRLDYLLKERGKVILIQPNYFYSYRQYWDDFTHVRAFTHVSLTDFLLSRGYKILRAEKKFIPFSFKSVLPKSYWMTKLYLLSFWRPLAKQMLIVAQR